VVPNSAAGYYISEEEEEVGKSEEGEEGRRYMYPS
jgi:hypothetical protein